MGELAGTFTKHSAADYTTGINYTSRIPSGVSVSSATLSAHDLLDGADVSPSVLGNTSATISNNTVQINAQAGVDGHDYLITVTTILSNADKVVDQLIMHVRDSKI